MKLSKWKIVWQQNWAMPRVARQLRVLNASAIDITFWMTLTLLDEAKTSNCDIGQTVGVTSKQ